MKGTIQEDDVVAIRTTRRSSKVCVTLRIVADQYLISLERKQASAFTIKHERECIKAILKHLPEDIAVESITTEYLEKQVFDDMRARVLKPNTINGRIKTIRRTSR